MFTQPCFIRKNTPEIITMLENIGIRSHPSNILIYSNEFIYVNRGFYSNFPIGYQEEIERSIDCGVNETLFLALAALRSDTCKYQYFVADEETTLNDALHITKGFMFMCCTHDGTIFPDITVKMHKATVQELIEHFSKKEGKK